MPEPPSALSRVSRRLRAGRPCVRVGPISRQLSLSTRPFSRAPHRGTNISIKRCYSYGNRNLGATSSCHAQATSLYWGNNSGDSAVVVSMSRRRKLANRLQIGAHPIVHLLRIGIAERVAHIEGDLAEERYREIERRPGLLDIQRAIRPGKLRPDVGWEQLLETAPIHPRLHCPVLIDLDAPFEHAPHRFELEILVQGPFGKDQLIAPEALGDIGRAPPELLDERLVLRLCRSGGDMRLIGWRLPSSRSLILVEQHPVAHVQLVRQEGLGGDALQQFYWPDAVIDLDVILIDHAPKIRGQTMHLALIAPTHYRSAIIGDPGIIKGERLHIAHRQNKII